MGEVDDDDDDNWLVEGADETGGIGGYKMMLRMGEDLEKGVGGFDRVRRCRLRVRTTTATAQLPRPPTTSGTCRNSRMMTPCVAPRRPVPMLWWTTTTI